MHPLWYVMIIATVIALVCGLALLLFSFKETSMLAFFEWMGSWVSVGTCAYLWILTGLVYLARWIFGGGK